MGAIIYKKRVILPVLGFFILSLSQWRCGGGLYYGSNQPTASASNSSTPLSFTPSSGPIGTLVTVSGGENDFSGTQSVTIGGVSALSVSQSSTSLVSLVMPGATSGQVKVTTSANGALSLAGTFTVTATGVPANQQGLKLVGTGNTGAANQANALAVSADGNTALIGGPADNSNQGAAWVFTRSEGVWTQQGSKLVGTGAVGAAGQGSVALSADGNTALIGGNGDNSNQGATWVFTRSGGVWTQQGSKLVGTGAVGPAKQGTVVALSADGNTALIGGNTDNGSIGAAWVFTRSGGVWTQQGSKLVGTGAVGTSNQGLVVLSADGNTALSGGNGDNGNIGATWVFTRSGGVWTQQGSKLVGTGAVGTSNQGLSDALSADGNTAMMGGFTDSSNNGAVWVFTRSGGVWTQQGTKLVGTGAVGASNQGLSAALSADGNTAMMGGHTDNGSIGAVWVFTRSGGVWTQQGSKLFGSGALGAAHQGNTISISADGYTAIIGGYNDNAGQGAAWVFTP